MGGDYVLCNKNGFIYPNEINFNALERNEIGASFELYSMLPEQLKINKKLSKVDLSTFLSTFWMPKTSIFKIFSDVYFVTQMQFKVILK